MRVRKLLYAMLVLAVLLAGWSFYHHQGQDVVAPAPPQSVPDNKQHLTITAAGDCLMHNTQIWSGQEGNTYNFNHFFQDIKPYLEEGQVTSTCFEAPMAGQQAVYAGYPQFNSPDEMADAFKYAGFDIIVTANNHSLDRGVNGAIRTLDVLKNRGLDTLGTYASAEASRKPLIKEANGIKVGYLAYTYGTNGIPVPERYAYLVNFIDADKIVADIKVLRPQVDIVVLVLHWGVEYTRTPTPEQKLLAHRFLESGADVILGSHPHVIQTMEVIPAGGQQKFVIYGMGNFISHQKGQERNSGIVLKITFSKDLSTNQTQIDSISYTPTFSHSYKENGKTRFRVIAVEETINRLQQGRESILSPEDIPLLQAVLDDTRKRLGPYWQRDDAIHNE